MTAAEKEAIASANAAKVAAYDREHAALLAEGGPLARVREWQRRCAEADEIHPAGWLPPMFWRLRHTSTV